MGSLPIWKSVDGDAADRDAPGLARLEQLVGVDLVQPADEVRLGIVGRAAVDRRVRGGRLVVDDAPLQLLGAALGFFRCGPFHVAAWHGRRVLWRPCRVRLLSETSASASALCTP